MLSNDTSTSFCCTQIETSKLLFIALAAEKANKEREKESPESTASGTTKPAGTEFN